MIASGGSISYSGTSVNVTSGQVSASSKGTTSTLSGAATGFILSGITVTASATPMASTRSISVIASYSGRPLNRLRLLRQQLQLLYP